MPICSLQIISAKPLTSGAAATITKQYNIKPQITSGERSPLINNIIKGFGLGAGSLMIHKAASVVVEKFTSIDQKEQPHITSFYMDKKTDCTEKLDFLLQHCNDNQSMYCEKLYSEYLDCLENRK